jgi:hypothetical protein
LEYGALIILKAFLVAHDFVVDPEDPGKDGIHDENVCEDRGDVGVPDTLEVEIKSEFVDSESIFEIG